MGVFGKIMDSMRIDDPDDGDFYGNEDPDDDAARGHIFRRNKSQDDVYDYPDEEPPRKGLFGGRSNNNTNINPVRRQEVCMVKPSSVDDSRNVVDCLNSGKAVVLNMEGISTEIAQRILDFAQGAAYSMEGKLQRISTYIFIVTPNEFELTGDFQDMLNSGQLDSSGINIKF